MLELRVKGKSDTARVTVDNIRLVKDGTCENLIVNGGFENPKVNKGWNGINGGISGWTCEQMKIGVGKIFNPRWTTQVC